VEYGHNVCPYSHTTRGNIDVAINLVLAGPVTDMALPVFIGQAISKWERSISANINHDRRRFLGTAVMTIAAAELVMARE
jgi:hypothetical protein